jgi:transposase
MPTRRRSGLCPRPGGVALLETVRAAGLDRALSQALSPWRKPTAVHDPAKVLLDLAVTLALGGDCLADIAVLREQPGGRWTPRSPGCTSTARPPRGACRGRRPTQGARWNDNNLQVRGDEPDDRAIGRSRRGLTTNTHALVDGRGRAPVLIVSPGQAGDSPALALLLEQLRVARPGSGRPRTTPTRLRGDKAYSSRGTRTRLRSRGITAVIPKPSDQPGHRRNRGSRGGRPVSYDVADYKQRNVVERFFNRMTNWRAAWPAGTTSTRSSTAAASSSPRSSTGSDDYRDTPQVCVDEDRPTVGVPPTVDGGRHDVLT